jgi:ureidoacrylate peracid hydrolase
MSSIEKLPALPFINRETALIVIDMQNDFVSENGYLGKKHHNLKPVQDTVVKIKKLLEFCRKNGIIVIFTQTIHLSYTDSNTWKRRSAEKANDMGICRQGSTGSEIIEDLAPLNGEPIVIKHRYDAFLDTDLDLILRSKGIRNILIAGTQTNLCVDTTARHGFMLDYSTILVEDCISTPETDLHLPMIRNFEANFGFVMPSSKIMDNCSQISANR